MPKISESNAKVKQAADANSALQREIDSHSRQYREKLNQLDYTNSEIEKAQISYLDNMRTLETKLKQPDQKPEIAKEY